VRLSIWCSSASGRPASAPPSPRGALVHALRHTFATRLAEDGATASEIQRLLGHASLNTSQGYIDATASEQRAAARANRTYRTLRDLAGE
jgi:integrase